jgi:hypothetical protein
MNSRYSDRFISGVAGTVLWLGLVLSPSLIEAQTNTAAPVYAPNRFLLVIETSRAMQHRVQPMLQAVHDVLGSNLAGQGRRGDTLGIWTFNEELHTGLIGLQQWSPEDQKKLTDRVTGFLSAQKYEKRCRFEKMLPALDRVVQGSPYLTVILICQGDEEIHGTPYDQRINAFFRTWQLQQQDAGTPFVIALRAQGGKYVDCTMNPSPWRAELPALPAELLAPLPLPPPHPVVVKEAPKAVTSTVPPLIISGRKRATVPLTQAADAGATNAAPNVASTTTAAAPAAVEKQNTISSSPFAGTKSDQASAAPAGQPDTTTADGTHPALPAEQTHSVPSTAPGAITGPEPSKNQPPASGETLAPAMAQAQQRETNSFASSSQSQEPGSPQSIVGPGTAGEATPVQAATNPSPDRIHPLVLAALGGLALVAAVGAIWVSRRRTRAGPETSLITESFDRRKR